MSRLDDRIGRETYIRNLGLKLQEYINEHPTESDSFLEGQDVTQEAAVELFNDLLLYMNDGEDLAEDMKVKVESVAEEELEQIHPDLITTHGSDEE